MYQTMRVVIQIKGHFSTACIKADDNCMLIRMHQCGQGANTVAKIREVSRWLEEVMKKEREVQWLAKLRSGQHGQKGGFWYKFPRNAIR